MNDTLSVIVLDQQEYKENDALVYVLSQEKGLRTFLAKGLRKLESKNSFACQPYSFSSFSYDEKEGSDFQLLHEAVLIESNRGLREDLIKSTVSSVLCEMARQLGKEGIDSDSAKELYRLIRLLLEANRDLNQPYLVLAFFYARIADMLGFSPMVDGCSICSNEKVNGISIQEGGFVCPECRIETNSPQYPPEILKQFRYLTKANIDQFEALKNAINIEKEVMEIYRDFLIEHAQIRLKSWAFLQKVL